MADTKLSALSPISVPALADPIYGEQGGASGQYILDRVLGLISLNPGGRLTLTSGTPVTTADVTGAGTIYYTPYLHDRIRIYDGTRWKVYFFTERSLALSLTSGKNYDVFIYDNAGTLTLELSAAWTNDTTRADALTTQDGVTVKSGALTRLWLGTIRASGTNTTEDSGGGTTSQVGGKRFVSNAYNRVLRNITVIDTTDSWSYTTNTVRQTNAATGNKVEFVLCRADIIVNGRAVISPYLFNNASGSAAAYKSGIGVNSTTAFSGLVGAGFNANSASTGAVYSCINSSYVGYVGAGYGYLAWLEKGAPGTSSGQGDNGGDGQQAGLSAVIEA